MAAAGRHLLTAGRHHRHTPTDIHTRKQASAWANPRRLARRAAPTLRWVAALGSSRLRRRFAWRFLPGFFVGGVRCRWLIGPCRGRMRLPRLS